MFKTIWRKFKENYAALITITTTFVTVAYAIIKFIIYTYWSGYFKRLNIDNNFMKLDYEGIIYQALLIFIMLLAVFYVMCTLETFYEEQWTKYKNKTNKKFLGFLSMTAMNAFISSILLFITNCPWLIFICAWGNFKLDFLTMLTVIFLLSLLEVGFVLHHLIFDKKSNNKEMSSESKLATRILSALIIPSLILSIIYFSGSKTIDDIQQVRLVENENYMITYSDGEKYVLHKVEIDGNKIVIKRNEQKVISNENVMCTMKEVNSVHVAD